MENGIAIQVVLPLALFTIMLGVGMSLRVSEFSLLWRKPAVVLVGVLSQLLLLPLLGWVVVLCFQLPPVLAVGVMILTFAPGGATSNMITYLSRGDTALSVCLTAVSGLITPFTMPILTVLTVSYWMGEEAAIEFPVMITMVKLLLISLLPALLGTLIHHRWPAFCGRIEPYVKVMACLFLVLVVFGIVKANWVELPTLVLELGPAVVVLVSLAMLLGYGVARQMRLATEQGITMAVEVGIQNAAMALLVTGGIFHNAEMSASALIYGILMNIPAFGLITYRFFTARTLLKRSV